MKMWLLSMILPGLLLTSNACSTTDEPMKIEEPTPAPDPQPTGGRALVVYFSCTNTIHRPVPTASRTTRRHVPQSKANAKTSPTTMWFSSVIPSGGAKLRKSFSLSSKAMTSRARPSFRSAPRTPAASGRAILTCIIWRPEPNGNRDGGSTETNRKKQLKSGLKV